MKSSKGMTPTTRGVANDPKIADTKSRKSTRLIKKTTGDFSKKSGTSKDSKMTKFSKALPPLDITKLESLSNPNKERLTVIKSNEDSESNKTKLSSKFWGYPDLSPGIENLFNAMELNDQIRNLLISMNLCSIKSMIQLSNLDLNDVIAFFHAKIYETLIFKRQS
jgi:hypothetical protein